MKKVLLTVLVLLSVVGCSGRLDRMMAGEENQSFIYRSDAMEVFMKIDCVNQSDCRGKSNLIVEEAKRQISNDENLDIYSQLLAMEYLDLAINEYHGQGDIVDGKYFFEKAVSVAKGEAVLPEDLTDWIVPRKNYESLKWAREDLVYMIESGGSSKDPFNIVKAQKSYDCWLEQQAEGLWELDVRVCRRSFRDAAAKAYKNISDYYSEEDITVLVQEIMLDNNGRYLDVQRVENLYYRNLNPEEYVSLEDELDLFLAELEDALESVELEPLQDILAEEEMVEELAEEIAEEEMVEELAEEMVEDLDSEPILIESEEEYQPIEIESTEESCIAVTQVEEKEYDIFFEWNYVKPQSGDREKIKQVADNFRRGKFSKIVLQAYTDKSGFEAANRKVSENRGRAVKNMLIEEGISRKDITFFAFGESSTPGPDNVKNAEYRRVIVIFE